MSALQAVDFHEVGQYLRKRNLVDERHLPYYIRWLQRFFAGPGGRLPIGAALPRTALDVSPCAAEEEPWPLDGRQDTGGAH